MNKEEEIRNKQQAYRSYRSCMSTIRKLFRLWQKNPAAYDTDGYRLEDYGLEFSFQAAEGQPPYWRWLLSWGGPSEEVRFYARPDEPDNLYAVEYWFYHWGFSKRYRISAPTYYSLLAELWAEYFTRSLPTFETKR